jgi:hypothetical protein
MDLHAQTASLWGLFNTAKITQIKDMIYNTMKLITAETAYLYQQTAETKPCTN